MKTPKIRLLAGAAAFALVNGATCIQAQTGVPAYYYYAAPYYGAPASMAPDRYYRPPPTGKIYVGFEMGPAFQQDITITDSIGDSDKATFGTGIRLDCTFGYNITTNWAAELDTGFIILPVDNSVVLGTDFMDVDFVEVPIMLNVIYTRPLGRHFSAYLGGGVGGAFSDYENEFGGTTEGDTTFAFQGLAGLKYTINERWDLGLTYKFLGTTQHDLGSGFDSNGNPTEFQSNGTKTHAVLLALTWKF
jgi:opacity protein-like surface antigen